MSHWNRKSTNINLSCWGPTTLLPPYLTLEFTAGMAISSPSSSPSSSMSGISSKSSVSPTVAPASETINTSAIVLASPLPSKSGTSLISPGFAAESTVAIHPACISIHSLVVPKESVKERVLTVWEVGTEDRDDEGWTWLTLQRELENMLVENRLYEVERPVALMMGLPTNGVAAFQIPRQRTAQIFLWQVDSGVYNPQVTQTQCKLECDRESQNHSQQFNFSTML
ncbi:hypothetical protein DEU56DRAFT_759721 [Suillus clintonianus]|uniref:uncharacterized protein n=1 Tax=Suillus clintonianus TaxID=1904413 RepID=UPI001B87F382|nr:uncharacterized protein DEU56DRAFT_759721 [Suillus clintonianus]KAG2124366.1 hypothetical protein DEU56DRAFT_759721 [Suillus clintonianus]